VTHGSVPGAQADTKFPGDPDLGVVVVDADRQAPGVEVDRLRDAALAESVAVALNDDPVARGVLDRRGVPRSGARPVTTRRGWRSPWR
jgi:hypothetical protein